MTIRHPDAVKWLTILAASTFSLMFALPGWSQGPRIPGPGEGYQLSPPNDTHQDPPPGYEGRTDYSSRTAIETLPPQMARRSFRILLWAILSRPARMRMAQSRARVSFLCP